MIVSAMALSTSFASAQHHVPQLGKDPISEVVKAMTLDEKANFVVGNNFYLPDDPTLNNNVRPEQKKVTGAAGTTYAIPRLGIPSIVLCDGQTGLDVFYQTVGRTYYATAGPNATLLASTWDTTSVSRLGAAFGEEAKEYGIDVILAPAMNIIRNPLLGRSGEYFSEDPLLSGTLGAAFANGIQSQGVGASIKHLIANNQESNRLVNNSIVSERALREIYLRNFEIAIKKSHPWTIMTSYNLVNGTYTSESSDLLRTILRNEWGFKGFAMTDWYGGKNPVEQMKAGNDLLTPGSPAQTRTIIEAVKSGALSEQVLDENITRILNVIQHTLSFKKYPYSDHPNLIKNAIVSKEVATAGMVLLKNNSAALPFKKNVHIVSLFGVNGYDILPAGNGDLIINPPYRVSLSDGLMRHSFTLEKSLNNAYLPYILQEKLKRPKKSLFDENFHPTPLIPQLDIDTAILSKTANASDIAIVSIGFFTGEGSDRKPEAFDLNDKDLKLIKTVSLAFHNKNKKVVVVLNTSCVIDVMKWRDYADAILLAWQPGLEGGNAITELLMGEVNPSGKLSITFPAKYEDVPSSKTFPGTEHPEKAFTGVMGIKMIPTDALYNEGIYVGYRYYNTFTVKPAYEFGYGLSYTNFSYSPVKLNASTFRGKMTATVTVTNTGKLAGKEVVELYLSAPKIKLDKPSEELKAFAKTVLLMPGKSQTITFTLNSKDLASYDSKSSSWIAEAGKYTVKIGGSSLDIKTSTSFKLEHDLVVEKDHKALTPQVGITELKK